MADTLFHISFPLSYQITTLHVSPISQFFSREGDSLVWDFLFFRSLHDREAEDAHSFAIHFSFFYSSTNPACLVLFPLHKLNTNDCKKRRPLKVLSPSFYIMR